LRRNARARKLSGAPQATYLVLGAAILLADLFSGPYLLFPILFVVPVALAAWYHSPILAYALALLLPLGRFAIALEVDHSGPLSYAMANALIRIGVLALMAYVVVRTARQTRELQERVSGLVRMCAWSRTIEYQGEWLSFEDYLKRRFRLDTTHAIAPAEAEKLRQRLTTELPRQPPREG
jgi:hypothetical protein